MEPNETMELPEDVGVDSAGNFVDLGGPLAPLLSTSLLEMWSVVLSNIDAEQGSKISPQAAMGVLSKWPTLTMRDVPLYVSHYYDLLSEYRDVLGKVVEHNPKAYLHTGEKDPELNRALYFEVVGRWQKTQREIEEAWSVESETAAIELAALADSTNFILGATGLVAHLEQLGLEPSEEELEQIEKYRNEGGDV